MTNKARIYNGEKTAFSINGFGKSGQLYAVKSKGKEEKRTEEKKREEKTVPLS